MSIRARSFIAFIASIALLCVAVLFAIRTTAWRSIHARTTIESLGGTTECVGRGPAILGMCVVRTVRFDGSRRLTDDEWSTVVDSINAMESVRTIHLSGETVNDSVVSQLSQVVQVRDLWLCHTAVTAQGLSELRSIKSLGRLFCGGRNLSIEDARALGQCKGLRLLSVEPGTLSADEEKELRASLPNLIVQESIDCQ